MASVDSSLLVASGDGTDVYEFGTRLRRWLTSNETALPDLDESSGDFDTRLRSYRELQRALYDAGWLRFGWPVALGGYGGDARHRAVLYDELGRMGRALRGPCEHLEIMAQPLVRHWAALDAPVFSAFLRGDESWCQGFSEPDAGSDLVALRTRAVRDGDIYVLSGRKVWTSWAGNATRCLVLARTGTIEERHRGLSVFFVDLATPGITVRRLRQANGSEELAEVTFDDVRVPSDRRVGAEGDGFAVTLDVLGCERSSFAWLRQAVLYARTDDLIATRPDLAEAPVGELMLDLFALRATAGEQILRLGAGRFPGPDAAVVKALLTRAEQSLYDTAYGALGSDLALGLSPEMARWQDDYLFSRAVSIYGGTKQIQMTTIARFVLGLPTGGP